MKPVNSLASTSPERLMRQVRALIDDPVAPLADDAFVRAWSGRLQSAMVQHPESRPMLGKLRGDLMRAGRQRAQLEAIEFVDCGPGRLAIGHRPRRKTIAGMKAAGTTHVVTLLGAPEGAETIGTDVKHAGLTWIWLPMESAEPPAPDRSEVFRRGLTEISEALDAGGSLYLHCSAGIHRTGMIAHALLRLRGLGAADALVKLGELRTVTAEGVGEHRIAWGHQFAC